MFQLNFLCRLSKTFSLNFQIYKTSFFTLKSSLRNFSPKRSFFNINNKNLESKNVQSSRSLRSLNVGTRASSHFVHESNSFWQRFSREKLIILHDVLNKLTLPQSVPKILMRFLLSNAATNANNAQSKSGSLREKDSNVPIDLLCRCFETWAVNRQFWLFKIFREIDISLPFNVSEFSRKMALSIGSHFYLTA